ncbi:POTRA domain-containing protein, partial [Pseudomonas aeruginosa]
MGMAMLSSCLANAAPDAGQALRDVESRRLNLPAPVELDAERPSPEDGVSRAAEEGGPTVLVKRFQLSGNRQFDDRRLLALLHDLPGQELNLSQLHAAAARIGDFYQEKGYVLARAFLPAQEIQDGTVRIEVLEGRYGRIELHNTSRTLDRVLLRPLSALERDTAVQGSELERALLLLSDIPGLQAKGTLLPGQAQGTTDLRVEARPGPLVGGRLEADNYGGRYMGEYRLGTTLDFNSPLRLGDQA